VKISQSIRNLIRDRSSVDIQELLSELNEPPNFEIGKLALEFNDDLEIFGDTVYVKIGRRTENAVLFIVWVLSGIVWFTSLFVKLRGGPQ
jgi:hypothetical protein